MPTDATASAGVAGGLGARLAFVTAGAFAAGLVFGWPLFYLSAVFGASFAQAPRALSPQAAFGVLAVAAGLLAAAFALSVVLLPYPVVFLAAIALGLVLAFRGAVRGADVALTALALLAVLLVPYLVRISPDLAATVSLWLVLNMGIALLFSWAAFALFPAGPVPEVLAPEADAVPPETAAVSDVPIHAERRLIRMCLVSIPFVLVFFTLESGATIVLIFVAILTNQLADSTGAGPMVAKGMIAANLAAGVVAVVVFEALVMVPFLPLACLLVLAVCLFFAGRGAAGHVLAATTLTTVLILLGGSLGPLSDGAETKMITRLWQVSLALGYILGAFVLVDRWLPDLAQKRA